MRKLSLPCCACIPAAGCWWPPELWQLPHTPALVCVYRLPGGRSRDLGQLQVGRVVVGTGSMKWFPPSSVPPAPQESCKAPQFTSVQEELAPGSGLHVQKPQLCTALQLSFSRIQDLNFKWSVWTCLLGDRRGGMQLDGGVHHGGIFKSATKQKCRVTTRIP